ncbi:MAG: cytochrome b/b6 domain-containing protein [Deltaproteobacteria bacterium]|nr:cytochrome b/b6 domain-containing protein [Deltaproteobacteria bacterium]
MQNKPPLATDPGRKKTPVWDLPTRLFHWLLVLLVAISFVTVKIGGNAMQYHERSGFTILMLLLFRLVWGVLGSQPSRFKTFLKGPATVLRYAATTLRREPECHLTHNPLGGWSVAALLTALLVQAGTGLFANDDIATEGPLYGWVSKATSDWITEVHQFNAGIIVVLIVLHVAAVLFHLIYKRDNLLVPMFTGDKPCDAADGPPGMRPRWLAIVIAAFAAAAVYLVVR